MTEYGKVTPSFIRELQNALGADAVVSDSEVSRICASYDGTCREFKPDLVVWARSSEAVSALMRFASRDRIPVYPRGAASGLSGGALPVMGGIVLDLAQMTRITELDAQNQLITVEPGIRIGDIQKHVEKRNLFYPPDPASSAFATIGGSVAENSGGLRGVKYGVTRDYVMALETVLPSGEIIRTGSHTRKDVTGFDLTRLLVGSEGTLGVFTKITLRLVTLPTSSGAVLAQFRNMPALLRAVEAILDTKILPRAIEALDALTVQLLRDYLKDLALEEGTLLLLEQDGMSAEQVESDCRSMERLCRGGGATHVELALEPERKEQLWSLRRAVSPAILAASGGRINEDICVPRNRLEEMFAVIDGIAAKWNVQIASFGHAGDGNIHVNALVGKDDPVLYERAEHAVDEVMAATVKCGGVLSGEHGIGIAKSKYLPLQFGAVELRLMRQIKNIFDPLNILNPGKIFPPE